MLNSLGHPSAFHRLVPQLACAHSVNAPDFDEASLNSAAAADDGSDGGGSDGGGSAAAAAAAHEGGDSSGHGSHDGHGGHTTTTSAMDVVVVPEVWPDEGAISRWAARGALVIKYVNSDRKSARSEHPLPGDFDVSDAAVAARAGAVRAARAASAAHTVGFSHWMHHESAGAGQHVLFMPLDPAIYRAALPPMLRRAQQEALAAAKEDVVIVDNDVDPALLAALRAELEPAGARLVVLEGMTRAETIALFRRAKVMIDLRLPGVELANWEAALFDACIIIGTREWRLSGGNSSSSSSSSSSGGGGGMLLQPSQALDEVDFPLPPSALLQGMHADVLGVGRAADARRAEDAARAGAAVRAALRSYPACLRGSARLKALALRLPAIARRESDLLLRNRHVQFVCVAMTAARRAAAWALLASVLVQCVRSLARSRLVLSRLLHLYSRLLVSTHSPPLLVAN